MTEAVAAVARQATFNTEPADSVSGKRIRRGNIELPVVDSSNVTLKTSTNDRNNNNNHKHRRVIGGDISDDDDDDKDDSDNEDSKRSADVNEGTDTEIEQSAQNIGYNANQPKNTAAAPSSTQSSPIYGSRSAYEKFNKKHAPAHGAKVKAPTLVDDSSDLDILSDVGIADDSDFDVVPVITPLSVSARRKIRKAPRIKIPSAKVDNTEPTIQEETTQDIINTHTPDTSSGKASGKNKDNSNKGRSHTVVFEKLLEFVADEVNEVDKESSVANANTTQVTPLPSTSADSVITKDASSETCVGKKDKHKTVPSKNAVNQALPTQSKHSNERTSSSEEKRLFVKSDKRSLPPDSEDAEEPATAREPKTQQDSTALLKKRPNSAGDKPKPKEVSPKRETFQSEPETRPESSRSIKTPNISNFLEKPGVTTGIESKVDLETTPSIYSGVPRPLNKKQIESASKIQFNNTRPPSQPRNPTDTMETSDGYDYESETFEEILQERNAMIRAERTYQKRIKQLEEELNGMINQCQALSEENKDLRKTIDGLKKAEKKVDPKPENEERTGDLTARIAKLETENENLAKTNEKLSSSSRDESSKRKQSEAVFVENTKLKIKNSELEKKVVSLQSDLEKQSLKLKEAGSDNSGKAAVLEFKNKELEVKVDELKYENKSLHSKTKTLENDKHLITNSLEEKRIELNELMRAMKNETVTENELKYSKTKLDEAQLELKDVRNELEDMKRMLEDSENKRGKLHNTIGQKETELKRIRSDQDHKDKIIGDLRSTNERLRDEVTRHEEGKHVIKDMERDTAALKSRIASLKTEIESSLSENQRLKFEREEANKEIDKLRNEHVVSGEAIMESRRYFRKWEAERELRNKAEVDLAKRQDEVNGLNSSLKESGMKINVLYGRVRASEEERERYRGPNAQELETNNKILRDENKKVRQMLIERNIELVNKTNEKEILDNRVGILEKKQKNSEFKVRQLSGWVGSMSSTDTKEDRSSNRQSSNATLNSRSSKNQTQSTLVSSHGFNHPNAKRTGVKEPIIAVISPRSRKKRTAPSTMTPPPSWDDKRKMDAGDGSTHTPLSLPIISESKQPRTPPEFSGGYFHMYKERMKRARDRRFPLD